jgi:hypothetical protein
MLSWISPEQAGITWQHKRIKESREFDEKVFIVLRIVVLVVVVLAVVFFIMQRRRAAENAHLTPTERIDALLTEHAGKAKTLQFAMNVPALGIRYSFSSTVPNQRYHSASAGKLMTSTLIFMAIDQGKLTLEIPAVF